MMAISEFRQSVQFVRAVNAGFSMFCSAFAFPSARQESIKTDRPIEIAPSIFPYQNTRPIASIFVLDAYLGCRSLQLTK